MTDSGRTGRRPVVLGPGEGRAYPMGRISAVFKADGAETGQLYSISEWWLDPHTKGPGAHSHPEDDVFYVLAGHDERAGRHRMDRGENRVVRRGAGQRDP
jgi:hypothetical protein